MSAWSDLPNSALIDRILQDLQLRPQVWEEQVWNEAWAVTQVGSIDHARKKAAQENRNTAINVALNAALALSREETLMLTWESAWMASAAGFRARRVASAAIAALIAWDHAGSYLDLPRDQIQTLMFLGDQIAILLLPAVIALKSNG